MRLNYSKLGLSMMTAGLISILPCSVVTEWYVKKEFRTRHPELREYYDLEQKIAEFETNPSKDSEAVYSHNKARYSEMKDDKYVTLLLEAEEKRRLYSFLS